MRQRRRTLFKRVFILLVPILVFSSIFGLCSRHSLLRLHHNASSLLTQTLSSVSSDAARVNVHGSPPRVDRNVLDKLRSLDSDEEYPTEASTKRDWPPQVTRLPTEDPQRQVASMDVLRDPVLDIELCSTFPCRLLLPTFIGEQESKAKIHLLQLSYLAKALNRTLVLPNVGRSRMGSCSKWDFGFYYDLGDFHEQVTFGAFRRWVALRAVRPRAQVIEILPARRGPEDDGSLVISKHSEILELKDVEVAISPSGDPSKMSHNHCLRGRASNLHFGDFSPLYIRPRTVMGRTRGDTSGFGRAMIAALSSSLITLKSTRVEETKLPFAGEPDVLLLNWEIRQTIFPLALDLVLPYADRWTRVAEFLSHRLQPFVAVHWRMERVPASSLLSCVPFLISSITSLLGKHAMTSEITTVYLATDYPTEGLDKPHSGTFHVGEEHHTIMRHFETSFTKDKKLKGVVLTNLVKELRLGGLLREDFSPDDLDPGLMGIIDKMVSTKSTLFISGGPQCGKTSSFTKQIIEERRRAKSSESSSIMNAVEYFG